ncbi:hypothetical protein BSFA1_46350 [Burkholderia sp. SFA1]|nr:hypothetical protein BSFA1_46350 [Burkholderia sp. SFA1]
MLTALALTVAAFTDAAFTAPFAVIESALIAPVELTEPAFNAPLVVNPLAETAPVVVTEFAETAPVVVSELAEIPPVVFSELAEILLALIDPAERLPETLVPDVLTVRLLLPALIVVLFRLDEKVVVGAEVPLITSNAPIEPLSSLTVTETLFGSVPS